MKNGASDLLCKSSSYRYLMRIAARAFPDIRLGRKPAKQVLTVYC